MFLSPTALLCSRKFCFSMGVQIFKKNFSESFFFIELCFREFLEFSIECMVHISEIQHLSEFRETFPGHFCTICRCFQFSNVLVEWKAPVVLQQQQHQTTISFMSKTTALHVNHAFWYISLTSTARLRRETSQCNVLWRTWTYENKFSVLYLNMDKDNRNLTPGKVAYI